MKNDLAIFEGQQIRRFYDEATEMWWFSVVDIVRVLTQSDYQAARKYWKVLKGRLAKEGSQLVTNCYQLKMPAADGKSYLTDAATAETLLRLIPSVPSPQAEAFEKSVCRDFRRTAGEGNDSGFPNRSPRMRNFSGGLAKLHTRKKSCWVRVPRGGQRTNVCGQRGGIKRRDATQDPIGMIIPWAEATRLPSESRSATGCRTGSLAKKPIF